MPGVVFDIILCGVVYGVLLLFIFFKNQDNRKNNDEGDDEGGLPVSLPPDIDLPPGVCLPDDPRVVKKDPEEVFA
ncbi:hypothetical protein C7460_10923 [Marinoscillum furvescens DSM 4134]|uniref:Uncharacterized protein n=2 Tax=Marinoscillum furvescens TaxID=1026 RepID=A0A3D9L256_MARFU|nr:hypothetical protein C7460_10923 [Marinoscillum furvescens DSM 4134]